MTGNSQFGVYGSFIFVTLYHFLGFLHSSDYATKSGGHSGPCYASHFTVPCSASSMLLCSQWHWDLKLALGVTVCLLPTMQGYQPALLTPGWSNEHNFQWLQHCCSNTHCFRKKHDLHCPGNPLSTNVIELINQPQNWNLPPPKTSCAIWFWTWNLNLPGLRKWERFGTPALLFKWTCEFITLELLAGVGRYWML